MDQEWPVVICTHQCLDEKIAQFCLRLLHHKQMHVTC